MARQIFEYEAIDAQGRIFKSELEALTEGEVVKDLTRNDLIPVLVTEKRPKTTTRMARLVPQSAASKKDNALALKQFALLLKAGMPLILATDSLKRQSVHPSILEKFDQISAQLRAGETFSTSFEAAFADLPGYVHRMAEAGEATGRLAHALHDASMQLEYEVKIAQDTRNALVYPSLLIVAGLSAVIFIFVVVVPRFAEMVSRSNVELPFLSKVVFGIGAIFNGNIWLFSLGFLAVLAFVYAGFKSQNMRDTIRNQASRLPVAGPWLVEAEVARWAMLTSAMLSNGIELLKALTLAEASVNLSQMRNKLNQVEKMVRGGTSFSASLEHTSALPAVALSLVEVGEEAGELPVMLNSVAELYEESGRQRMKRLLALIEPAAILLLGGIVGTIVTAVMLALTSINQVSI